MGTPYRWPLVVEPDGITVATEVTALGRVVTTDMATGTVTVVATGDEPPPPPPPPPTAGNPMGVASQGYATRGDVTSRMAAGDTADWSVATTDGSARGNSPAVTQVLTGPKMYVTQYGKLELDVSCTIRDSSGVIKETLGPQRIPLPSERILDLTTYGMHGGEAILKAQVAPRTAMDGVAVTLEQWFGDTLAPTHYRQWVGSEPAADVGWVPAASGITPITTTAGGQTTYLQAKFAAPASAAASVVRTYVWKYTLPTGVVWMSPRVGLVLRSQAAFAAKYPALGTYRAMPRCRPDRYPNWRVDSAPASELAVAGDWIAPNGTTPSSSSAQLAARFAERMNATFPQGRFFVNSSSTGYTFPVNETIPTSPVRNIVYFPDGRQQPSWGGSNGANVPVDLDTFISSAGTDGQAVLYDPSTDLLVDVWQCRVAHDDNGVVQVFSETQAREPGMTTTGDYVFDVGTVSASGCVIVASQIGLKEIQEVQRRKRWNDANPGGPFWSARGAIPFMITFAAPLGDITWRWRSWPAKANDGWANDYRTDLMMEGQRIRLAPTENPDSYYLTGTASYFASAVAWAARDHGMMCTDMAGAYVISVEDDRGYSAAWGIDALSYVTADATKTRTGTDAGLNLSGVPWTSRIEFLKRSWGQNGAPIGRTGTDPSGWVQGGPQPATDGYGAAYGAKYGTVTVGGGGNTATTRFGLWHHGWTGPALRDYPAQVKANLTNVCLGMGQGSGSGDFNYQPYNGQSVADHAADVRAFVASGKNVSVGVGGSGGGVKVLTQTHADQFVAAVQRHVTTYGINGVNLDIESNEWDQVPLANACMQLRAMYGPTFQIEVTTSMYEPLQTKWMNFLNYLGHDNYSWTGPMLYDFVESTDSRLTGVSLSKCVAMAAAGVPQNKMTLGYMLQPYPGYNASPNLGVITAAYSACKAAYPQLGGMWLWEDGIDQGRSWEWSLGAKASV